MQRFGLRKTIFSFIMKPLYFRQLDLLRLVAFSLVFWQHAFHHSFDNVTFLSRNFINTFSLTGGIGVQIFFVLSGFLITFLLLKEKEKTGAINIKYFYIRRVLRIWPLYYIVVIFGIYILPNISDAFVFCGNELMGLTFLNNIDSSKICTSSENVSIVWSVAIEEQFYLFWPLLFTVFIKNKKVLIGLCFVVYLGSSLFILNNRYPINYYHTYANLNYLMVGCIGALFYNRYQFQVEKSIIMKKHFLSLGILVLIFFVWFKPVGTIFIQPFLYLYIILFLVINNNDKGSKLAKYGKYTYGMYMYHPLFLMTFRLVFDAFSIDYKGDGWLNSLIGILALVFTVAFSILSYEFVEKRFLKYKNKLAQVKTRI